MQHSICLGVIKSESYFDGGLLQLIGYKLLGALIITLTLGIYSFWVGIKLKKWRVSHTHTSSGAQVESSFDGGLLQLRGYGFLGVIISTVTLGICLPWAYTMLYNWEAKHTVINGFRLQFDGSAIGLFGNWIKWFLLSIITLGIYSLWIPIKLKKWRISHTYFA